MKKYLLLLLLLPLCWGCKKTSNTPKQPLPKEYATAYIESYGQHYDSIAHNVFSLDIYSAGLDLDSTLSMQGSGYNLYLSDIFCDSAFLAPGTYHSDSTGAAGTFLRGESFDGMPHGCYLLEVDNKKVTHIEVFSRGSMVYSEQDGTADLTFAFLGTKGDTIYQAHFRGPLTAIKRKK